MILSTDALKNVRCRTKVCRVLPAVISLYELLRPPQQSLFLMMFPHWRAASYGKATPLASFLF